MSPITYKGAAGDRSLAQAGTGISEPRGAAYWEYVQAIAQSPDFLEHLRSELPAFAYLATQACDRRRFLQLAAASMALGGLAGCGPETAPRDRQAYVEQPEGIIPGRARYYATATTLQGYASGVLIQHQMGRPIKVEGNPDHPASLGATSAIGQATILGLYDPFRAQTPVRDHQIETWQRLTTEVLERRAMLLSRKGRGLALLTGAVTSPTLLEQMTNLRQELPELVWYRWEPFDRDQVRLGALQAFGRAVDIVPDFTRADVIVAVESDFLDSAPGHLRFARDFASRRRAAEQRQHMSRLYAMESTPTLAGAKADHRLLLRPEEIEAGLHRLAGAVGAGPSDWAGIPHADAHTIDAIARDLRQAQGRALVHVGAAQSAVVHTLAHVINHQLGAFGSTAIAIEPVEPQDAAQASLAELAQSIEKRQIDTLLLLGASNPVFTAPADLELERLLEGIPFSVYLGEYADETAGAARWHVPQAHEYETWGDCRAYDGTATIQQPQLQARAERRSAHDLLDLLSGRTASDPRSRIAEHWRPGPDSSGASDFQEFWSTALRMGVVPGTAAARVDVGVRPQALASLQGIQAVASPRMTVLFRPDPFLWDGRFADNGWLQELGRPFTRLTWDNAALIGPRTAQRLGIASGDIIEIVAGGRRVRAPVWILAGQADDCVTVPLGYGRQRSGPVAAGVGFNGYPLRSRQGLWLAAEAALHKTDGRHPFAPIQPEGADPGRDLVRTGTLAELLRDPRFLASAAPARSLYPGVAYGGIAWAMSINLNACIGCQACVAACQAENNSPVVGKTQVMRGREMHWLRIDRYYQGALENPKVVFQPVPCMHCENAPCEVVCPVHATLHDSEGLNVMVYNRCVGTRFCSNNCPYKVRRFNFFDYTSTQPRPRESWNPEVSVRARGVMEKCTFCVQRTRLAMIEADKENRRIRDGEVRTACQQACPTQAITFGDRNDPHSAVAARKASPLDYVMLESLNTRPRTSYEALIRNPSPDLSDV